MKDRAVEAELLRLTNSIDQLRSEIRQQNHFNRRNTRWIMKEIDDLKTADDAQTQALTSLTTAVTDATKKITDLAGQIISATDLATAQQIAQDILTHNDSIAKAASDLEAAVNPPADSSGTQTS